MMPPFLIRSTIFNLCFYMLTAVMCVALLPTLLFPRKVFLNTVYLFVGATDFLERWILGLYFEVRGFEHLPENGSFLVAAKHQSAYETTKLHVLFEDPAIVLKKELLKIPLWGLYLAKSDVIAIDRSTPKAAVQSIQDGAKRMAAQGRPVVIFTQGTRVSVDTTIEQKPYKIGIVRMQEATGLPIIPLALNTGVFWPRNSWIKKPGIVIFEFLPPVMPKGDAGQTLAEIQNVTEACTQKLIQEGLESIPHVSKGKTAIAIGSLLLCVAYCLNWFVAADLVKKQIALFQNDLKNNPEVQVAELSTPVISGFPFQMQALFGAQKIQSNGNVFEAQSMTAKSWPFWGMPITIDAVGLSVFQEGWPSPLQFESFQSKLRFSNNILDIGQGDLSRSDLALGVSGPIDFSTQPYPTASLVITLSGYQVLLNDLLQRRVIEQRPAMMAAVALQAMESDGVVSANVTTHENKVYLGPLKIYEMPLVAAPAVLDNGQSSAYAQRRVKPVVMPAPGQ